MPATSICPDCDIHKGLVSRKTVYRCTLKRRQREHAPPPPDMAMVPSEVDDPAHGSDSEGGDLESSGPGPDEHEELDIARRFACELLEQTVRKNVKQKGITDILRIVKRHYGHHLLQGITIPASWYKVRKLAVDGKLPLYLLRHLCPECDWIFPLSGDKTARCARCKCDTRWQPNKVGHPARTAAYFDIADIFARACANEPVADALMEFEGLPLSDDPPTNRQMDDALDGTILHDLVAQARQQQAQADTEQNDDEVGSEVEDNGQGDVEARSDSDEGDQDCADGEGDEGDEGDESDDSDPDEGDVGDEEVSVKLMLYTPKRGAYIIVMLCIPKTNATHT